MNPHFFTALFYFAFICIPLIACERGSVGSVGSTGSKGKVRRMKIRSAAEYKKGDAQK